MGKSWIGGKYSGIPGSTNTRCGIQNSGSILDRGYLHQVWNMNGRQLRNPFVGQMIRRDHPLATTHDIFASMSVCTMH
ncbi:hypothetical protein CEXT_475931 [Caerostris extrusa]|uniref:Uncharacterized protein n=1 Tax=Caerostris extrusa TaxID=172846 RepID=A0AAV4T137_CAEEX|nr:hypothetical protein CEXT_475931 [Caerostris extrusa]